jgi:hypothetical protein
MIYKKDYFGFVYIWFDSKRKKFLIGSHHGSDKDGYITSTGGKLFLNAYKKRPGTFKRKIVEYNSTEDNFLYTQKLEQKWLDKRPDIALNEKYYNQKQWATGGFDISIKRTKPDSWVKWKSEHNKQRVLNGEHNFTSELAKINAAIRVSNGSHHFITSDFNKKPFTLYKNGIQVGVFESKVDAVGQGWPAHLIDKLRKSNNYTIIRGSYGKELYNPGDYFEYENQS